MITHIKPPSRPALALKEAEQSTPNLRKVRWCNVWNRIRAYDTDGIGSKTHLTDSESVTGTTLCGKVFPANKGFPSSLGYCKRCVKKAYRMGYENRLIAQLSRVDSVEDD